MQIIYCEKCGRRVTDGEIDRGQAIQIEDRYFCGYCSKGMTPPQDHATPILRERRSTGPKRPPTAGMAPGEGPSTGEAVPASTIRQRIAARAKPLPPPRPAWPLILLAIATAIGCLVGVWLFASRSPGAPGSAGASVETPTPPDEKGSANLPPPGVSDRDLYAYVAPQAALAVRTDGRADMTWDWSHAGQIADFDREGKCVPSPGWIACADGGLSFPWRLRQGSTVSVSVRGTDGEFVCELGGARFVIGIGGKGGTKAFARPYNAESLLGANNRLSLSANEAQRVELAWSADRITLRVGDMVVLQTDPRLTDAASAFYAGFRGKGSVGPLTLTGTVDPDDVGDWKAARDHASQWTKELSAGRQIQLADAKEIKGLQSGGDGRWEMRGKDLAGEGASTWIRPAGLRLESYEAELEMRVEKGVAKVRVCGSRNRGSVVLNLVSSGKRIEAVLADTSGAGETRIGDSTFDVDVGAAHKYKVRAMKDKIAVWVDNKTAFTIDNSPAWGGQPAIGVSDGLVFVRAFRVKALK